MGRVYHGFDLMSNGHKVVVAAFVDTGSDSTIISRRVARALKLRLGKKEELETAGGPRGRLGKEDAKGVLRAAGGQTIEAGTGSVRVVNELDGIDAVVKVLVTDVPFKAYSDENIDMIIGLDFLQKHKVKLSFKE